MDTPKKGLVSIAKFSELGLRSSSPCKIDWNVDYPGPSSTESLSIPTPNHNSAGELADGLEGCRARHQDANDADYNDAAGGPDSSEWQRTQIVVCEKAVGVSVSNNDGGWEPILEFAQTREEQNRAAR